MNCALELLTIKEEAEKQFEIEEALKDIAAYNNFETIKKNTINFCDTEINNALIEKAKSRCNIYFQLKISLYKDRLGNVLFSPVIPERYRYANGQQSYTVDTNKQYSLNTLKEYLEAHCINVELIDGSYMRYGYGCQEAKWLRVWID